MPCSHSPAQDIPRLSGSESRACAPPILSTYCGRSPAGLTKTWSKALLSRFKPGGCESVGCRFCGAKDQAGIKGGSEQPAEEGGAACYADSEAATTRAALATS